MLINVKMSTVVGNFIASTLLSDVSQILTVYLLLIFFDRKFKGGNLNILEYFRISFSVAVST